VRLRRRGGELKAGWGRIATVIPNGVDSTRFAAAVPDTRFGTYLLSVGGIEPRKGSLDLLDAYALPGLVAGAAAFAFPSTKEGFGLAAMEALAGAHTWPAAAERHADFYRRHRLTS
jgi:glycosyltransferase involved in cell wall biosynthesis